ncbi:MAG: twin-arginine translocase subunit TatC [Synergistaceae bacterium]|jgi:sec-independent protein translocase protein TatC|nr:twin-arginine translocase subunit TatC [Synergistaceae bacterium]
MTNARRGDSESEWTEHLDELRRRLIVVLVIFAAAAGAAFRYSDAIVFFLMNPVLKFGVKLYTFAPAEKFLAYLEISLWTGAVIALPFALLQIGVFIRPGLRDNERVYAAAALSVIPILFAGGAALAYFCLSPIVMRFFLSFAGGDAVDSLWGLREYLKILFDIMLASGLAFQTPLVMLLLFAVGATTPRKAARYRPHIALVIFFMAAVLTPPDVISQIALGVPLYLLFELSLLLGRLIRPKS